jgi:ABC-type branched-subunit amino acid transport system ATPase component
VPTEDARATAVAVQDGGGILEVRQLTVAYGAKMAVDAVSFEIRRGQIFGLLGPNGAGKTSTLSAIEGLLKPQSGTVLGSMASIADVIPTKPGPEWGCSFRRPAFSPS